ncbi:MAG: ATP-binding protein, partial [Desulfobulbaceae bacterium]|nr:ATP-binding protein [Desulfobulbaceae bacterium]
DVGEGTGLGLSISYSTIKSHGGDIVVTSEEGSGSTFEIVLPVAADR